jgi:hypothetical protein
MNTRELVDRLAAGGQEALDRVSSELLANPVTAAAMQRAASAKQRVDSLGESALGQLHLPTADEVAEIGAKVRAVATRTERIEATLADVLQRLERLEAKLDAHTGTSDAGGPSAGGVPGPGGPAGGP